MRKVVMVGAFPPPTHGMSVINEALFNVLIAASPDVKRVNTAARNLSRGAWARVSRLAKILPAISAFLEHTQIRRAIVYIGVSGGVGQVYDALFVLLARARRIPVCLHHHSFAYLDRPGLVSKMLIALAGDATRHVVLSAEMGRRLERLGVDPAAIRVLSNAAFLSESEPPRPLRPLRTLGFLSNVCEEKGVNEFIALASKLEVSHPALRLILAGPFQDSVTERKIMALLTSSVNVRYVGAKYGQEKEMFFSEIDVLVFPTKYANEAEPVTLHEAMRNAVPVIAYGRGAIPEMITSSSGLVINPSSCFEASAKEQIEVWIEDPDAFQRASTSARARFTAMADDGQASLKSFVAELLKDDDMQAERA
ncbi:glycosyltransferase family 4 protein [Cognatiluteimonas profundi]|uniref:glycosyltransferase family 4 protein n=1 Tax=Cognatiluteimonas profundi TaxID=2594501 RepID=UPI00131B1848|nr:glycosyltransferase family 4 protein [Lysobacter profundi]